MSLPASQRSLTARLLVLLGGQSPGRLGRPSPPPLGRLAAPLAGARTQNGALGGAYAGQDTRLNAHARAETCAFRSGASASSGRTSLGQLGLDLEARQLEAEVNLQDLGTDPPLVREIAAPREKSRPAEVPAPK